MAGTDLDLLSTRRFWPLLLTQFLGAFNDNLFKISLTVLVVYGAMRPENGNVQIIATLMTALFILPFFLFSALAGQFADRFDKRSVIRTIKAAEMGIVTLAALGFLTASLPILMSVLFLLGTHSALFTPSKYAVLPQHLRREELVTGNAFVNTATFLAILLGTILGGALANLPYGVLAIICLLTICAAAGFLASALIPQAPAPSPNLKLNFNIVKETIGIVRYTIKQPRGVMLAILGASWFYFIGGTLLTQFPAYARDTVHASETVLAFFLTVFSIGIAIGGLLNNRFLKGRVEATYVPIAALGVTAFMLDLAMAGAAPRSNGAPLMGLGEFLTYPAHWRILMDMFGMAVFGGLYVVPLNSIVQDRTPEDHRARVLAGGSVIDALFITTSSLASAGLIYLGLTIPQLFLTLALANAIVALYVCRLLPDQLFKSVLQALFKLLYRVEIRGIENVAKAGKRFLVIGNHVSLLDPPLLAAFLPGKPMFALHTAVAQWWWVKPWLRLVDAFPMDPTNPFSTKALIAEIKKDKYGVIFPEGRLTETGALMKVYEGPGMIADKADAMILPVRLDGVQHTPFARLKGKVPLRRFPKVTLTILEPREFRIADELKGRKRRQAASLQLYDLMENMMFLTRDREQTLFSALLQAQTVNGASAPVCEDVQLTPMSYRKLIRGALALGDRLACITERAENVGLMLPNSCGAVVTFFALQAYGRVPAMLNYSAGIKAMRSACRTAEVKTVITSRRFIELARLDETIAALSETVRVVYLEDIRKEIGPLRKLKALALPAFAERLHARQAIDPKSPAVVLFTSGSEGEPKGVVLSHVNLMSNILQLSARMDFNRQDVVFNALPIFHSFGLTGGMLLPVLSGVKTVLYPSPLHYRIVPEMAYATNATILFGTDTFLTGYARLANPYDFYRVRYVFAGAERVRDETRRLYMERFGVRILEGYGTTETAPVIAVNSPMHSRTGTVGRLLPGITARLEPVPGVDRGGRLFVKGPNVMCGYLLPQEPGVLNPPDNGWHDTGDIVDIDPEGYVTILGRAKRFAKIAGEMVSLASVETMAQAIYPDSAHAVVAIPDAKKGEQLVWVTTAKDADRARLLAYASEKGIPELSVPRLILPIAEIPVLGTGKTDYPAVQELVRNQVKTEA